MLGAADVLLTQQEWIDAHRPDVVLHLGRRVVSKHVQAFASCVDQYVVVCPDARPLDPLRSVNHRVTMSLDRFCDMCPCGVLDAAWSQAWKQAGQAVQDELDAWYERASELSEPFVARAISKLVSSDHAIFVANSMPVRDLDQYAVLDGCEVAVAANRGVSGIDGTVMSAVGYACGLQRPVTLYIGDLSLLHDLNGLLAVARSEIPMTLVVVNNRGGGIFHFLPIAETLGDAFEPWFGTPHHVDVEKSGGDGWAWISSTGQCRGLFNDV